MKVLLDTHVVLWWLSDDKRISKSAKDLISDTENQILVSTASAYEVAFKNKLDKLDWDVDALRVGLGLEGFETIAITWAHAAEAGRLSLLHRDPFDRIIAAQAILEGALLVTNDKKLVRLIGAQRANW